MQVTEFQDKQYFRSSTQNNMYLLMMIFGIFAFLLILLMGSAGGGSILLTSVIGAIFYFNRNKPVLSIDKDCFSLQFSPIASSKSVLFSDVSEVSENGKKIRITLKYSTKPLVIPYAFFNKQDRDEIGTFFTSLVN
jgi:hypothetical protein